MNHRFVHSAFLFVDWDSARRLVLPPWPSSSRRKKNVPLQQKVQHAVKCFSALQTHTAATLERICGEPIVVKKCRLYHGWHQGKTATDDRRAIEKARGEFRTHISDRVSFLPEIEFGNELTCGGPRLPLLDTVRARPSDNTIEQKMVDTALVADLLCITRTESRGFSQANPTQSMAIIIADDDDVLPGAVTAERWGLPVHVLRVNRTSESPHIRTAGLVEWLRAPK